MLKVIESRIIEKGVWYVLHADGTYRSSDGRIHGFVVLEEDRGVSARAGKPNPQEADQCPQPK